MSQQLVLDVEPVTESGAGGIGSNHAVARVVVPAFDFERSACGLTVPIGMMKVGGVYRT